MSLPKLDRMDPVQGLHKGWSLRTKRKKWPDVTRTTGFANVEDPRIAEILKKIGRDKAATAKRVIRLGAYYPQATLPELLVADWLKQRNIEFFFQELVAGGRLVKGGRVLDFVIPQGGQALVIGVHGNYWHPDESTELMTRLIIMSAIIAGMTVLAYVETWENDIYQDIDWVMTGALNGIQLSRPT